MIWTILRLAGAAVLVLLIVALLAIVIVPRFLDRDYYRGPVSDHFDGARFFNPQGDDTLAPPSGRSRGGFLSRYRFGRDHRPAWPARSECWSVAHAPGAHQPAERRVVTRSIT